MAARQLICLLLCLFFIATRVCAEKLPEAYKRIAQLENVPAEVLYSLALAESSYELSHGVRPWPWTLNVAGKAYRYPTRWEAYQATLSFIQRYPLKRIDVGIAQINLGWNGHYFNSVWHAFDPYLNLRVAARLLYGCYQRHWGSWIAAAGCYHRPAGGKQALIYQYAVQRHLSRLSESQREFP